MQIKMPSPSSSSSSQINPASSILSRTSLITLLVAALTSSTHAQSITQPTSNTSITSFSGQGSIPFQYSPSGSDSDSVNVELVQDGIDFQLANGLLSSNGDNGVFEAVFAPLSGFCGEVGLRVTENSGNTSSSDSTTVPITITCGPVQRTRSLPVKRQDQGGPSGSLDTPSGGTQYTSPDDAIRVAYTPVTEGGQTFAIDGALTSESANYTLFNGLWKQNSSSEITASFAIPSEACGAFNFIITEHQFYQNGAIQFQSAAPSINITCPGGSSNGTNSTVPIGGGGVNSTTSSLIPTSTGVNATSTTSLNSTTSTSTSTLSTPTSGVVASTSGLTNATSTSLSPNATSTSLSSNATSTSLPSNAFSSSASVVPTNTTTTSSTIATTGNTTSTAIPSSINSTSSTALSTNSNSTQAAPTFTGNITLPIETSTITSPTTIVSTVTTTFTQSGQTGTVTSVVTTTVSPSSTSTSSDSTRPSDTSTSNTSTTTSNGGGGGGGNIRTTTVTQTPSSQASNAGITTVTVTPSTTPSSSASISRQTSTYTTTEVVVVAVPGRSSITSTRLQTVILVSQTIAAIVAPSSANGGNGNGGTGAAVANMVIPWSMTLLAGIVTTATIFFNAL